MHAFRLFLWGSKCIIEAVVSVFGVRLSTGGVAHIIGWLCGSNLCKKKKIFSEYIYLFIGETCYIEEKILCLNYKYIPIFYYRFFVNVCTFFALNKMTMKVFVFNFLFFWVCVNILKILMTWRIGQNLNKTHCHLVDNVNIYET